MREKKLYNIYGLDILVQVEDLADNSLQFNHVKGHDDSQPDNLNHLVDILSHYHTQACISGLELRINKRYEKKMKKMELRKDVFRLEHLKNSKASKLDQILILRRLHNNCTPT
eukprot:NODE_415_length_7892_cov_0.421917.p5 type:complete len:113 gc:universal NODE_415_length_7892_cov_0.421917:3955-4293(+)